MGLELTTLTQPELFHVLNFVQCSMVMYLFNIKIKSQDFTTTGLLN